MRFIIPDGFSEDNPVVQMVKKHNYSLASVERETKVSKYKLRMYFNKDINGVLKKGIEQMFTELLKNDGKKPKRKNPEFE